MKTDWWSDFRPPRRWLTKSAGEPGHALLRERQHSHGAFRHQARVAQRLKFDVDLGRSLSGVTLTDEQREALDMIASKIARIISGDPDHADHWSDIAGDSTLVAEKLSR